MGPAVGAVRAGSGHEGTRINVDHIPQGVTPMSIDGLAAMVSRVGDDFIVFAGSSPRPWDALGWCADVKKFVTIPTDSAFDRFGTKLWGPAPRSLDRFASKRDGDDLVVLTSVVEYHDYRGEPTGPDSDVLPDRRLLAYSPQWAENVRTPPECPRW